ncbi:MAG TPA: VUT family protein [Trueperaceae bacterium]|nr:VUT family protein [Trueperaceae bacterium]
MTSSKPTSNRGPSIKANRGPSAGANRASGAQANPTSPSRAWLLVLAGASAGVGPAVLLWLAGFGQQPPERLPLVAIALFGALFTGVLSDLRATGGPHLLTFLGVGLLGAAATLVTPLGDPRYLLAPLAAGALAVVTARLGRPGLLPAATVYIACTLLANYTLDSFLPLGDFFLVNVGTLFFGITFTQRDRVHRYGRRAVYLTIISAAVVNVALSAALGTPLRYIAVSFFSIVLAETADTEIFQRLKERRWLTRVATSNAVSAPLDTLIFTLLAFWGEAFATPAWITQVIVTDVVVKYGSGMLAALGVIALVRSALPRPGEGPALPNRAP